MMILGSSPVNSNSNQILQPNLAGGADPSGAHFTNAYGSIVGGTTGCGSDGGSASSLAGNPGYNIEKVAPYQKGGSSHRRGGKKRSSKKRSNKKRSSKKRSSHKKRSHRRGHKRSMRGGLAAFSPSSFSGASNPPYHQFTGSQPLSFNFGLGSTTALPPDLIGMASPPPMSKIENNCGPDYGLVSKGLLN